jgi:hypothetical protein
MLAANCWRIAGCGAVKKQATTFPRAAAEQTMKICFAQILPNPYPTCRCPRALGGAFFCL